MCTVMVLFTMLYLRYMEIWWINFEKKLKFRNLYVHQIVHMMGSKVMKIQMLIHTTQAFW